MSCAMKMCYLELAYCQWFTQRYWVEVETFWRTTKMKREGGNSKDLVIFYVVFVGIELGIHQYLFLLAFSQFQPSTHVKVKIKNYKYFSNLQTTFPESLKKGFVYFKVNIPFNFFFTYSLILQEFKYFPKLQ